MTDFAQRTIDLARQNVAEGGPKEVIFLVMRESYQQYYLDDRKYFEVATFYDEFAKAKVWDQRRLPMRYQPTDAAVGVYRFWNERNGGERKSTVVPPG